MNNLTNFTDNIVTGLNNPDCSFWVGATTGQYLTIKLLLILAVFTFLFELIDKLVIEQIVKWIKLKVFKKKKVRS